MFRGAAPPFLDIFELGEAKEKLFATAVNIKSRLSLTVLLLTKRKKADVVFVFPLLFRNPAERCGNPILVQLNLWGFIISS
jgi:hypothetical protein